MKRFSAAIALLFLVACTATPAPSDGASSSAASEASVSSDAGPGNMLNVRLEKTMSEDSDGTQRTHATLHLTGSVGRDLDLGDILGELKHVDPASYSRFAKPNADVIAAFTTWWAGGGEEIYVTQHHDPHTLTIERRYGDEGGVCNPPELLFEFVLPGDVTVTTENFGDMVERSSIDFPCTQP